MASVTKIVGTGTNQTRSGSVQSWADPTNITADDANRSQTSDLQNLGHSDWLEGTMSGNVFAIAANQQIDGIEVDIEWKINSTGSGDSEIDEVHLVSSLGDSNTKTGDGTGDASETYKTDTFGGATDTWGLSLTPAVVNATSFGVRASWAETDNGNGKRQEVDYISITVHHSDAPQSNKQHMVIE